MAFWVSAVSIYLVPMVVIGLIFVIRRHYREVRSEKLLSEAVAAGLTEPPSLHPLINSSRCIGCGSCISACPEGAVLGMIDNRAVLVRPADCIGHGACRTACPENAIELVFGTEARGLELPDLSPAFETSVSGIYIAGELGGMGLIKNAIEQGKRAIDNIAEDLKLNEPIESLDWDCIIVGCGPAGLSAVLQARERGVHAFALDRGRIGGTVAHFPRQKLVMTAPVDFPGVGKVRFHEIEKEQLIEFWQEVIEKHQPLIHEHETLQTIRPIENGFCVTTDKAQYSTRKVLLALGRRGTPRKLNIEGEELSKVVYELDDPAQYKGAHVMVVGGGDSALEAATSIAECAPASIMLSYRGENFNRAKQINRSLLEECKANGILEVKTSTSILRIDPEFIELQDGDSTEIIRNDQVIVCIGGVLPTGFLKEHGIDVSTKHGQA